MKHIAVAALALHAVACSSALDSPAGDGGLAASGGSGGGIGGSSGPGGTASGGSGGVNQCGPGDQDCLCPGGTFECQNNRTTCVCPPECTRSDQCGQDALCYFHDGNCGSDRAGYCLSRARASQWTCADKPACGCDGNLYDSQCDALGAGVSANVAPTRDCTSQPLPCSTWPSTASCNPTSTCTVRTGGGQSCGTSDGRCISYNDEACDCETLPSGVVRLTCTI